MCSDQCPIIATMQAAAVIAADESVFVLKGFFNVGEFASYQYNYYIEAQTRDQTRTDIVVDYLGQQYIIELKIWRGERYNAEGEQQLSEYLDYFGLDVGYMLSFNFNKKKTVGVQLVRVGDKTLYEGTL